MTPSVMICFSKSSSLFCQCHPMLVSSHFLPVAPINVRGHIGVQLSSTMAVLVYLTYSETSLRLIETVFWWPFWKQRHDKYFWLSFSVNCEDPYTVYTTKIICLCRSQGSCNLVISRSSPHTRKAFHGLAISSWAMGDGDIFSLCWWAGGVADDCKYSLKSWTLLKHLQWK